MSEVQRATIVVAGNHGVSRSVRRSEPYAKLADGRTMPMGWNMGQVIPVGTTGLAEYLTTTQASLWRFTSDEKLARRLVKAVARVSRIGATALWPSVSDEDAMFAAENEILASLDLPLGESEQGLSEVAVGEIERFVRRFEPGWAYSVTPDPTAR